MKQLSVWENDKCKKSKKANEDTHDKLKDRFSAHNIEKFCVEDHENNSGRGDNNPFEEGYYPCSGDRNKQGIFNTPQH